MFAVLQYRITPELITIGHFPSKKYTVTRTGTIETVFCLTQYPILQLRILAMYPKVIFLASYIDSILRLTTAVPLAVPFIRRQQIADHHFVKTSENSTSLCHCQGFPYIQKSNMSENRARPGSVDSKNGGDPAVILLY